MLSWASITPFGTPVVPEVNTSWKMSSLAGGSQAAWVASQSGGKAGSSATRFGAEGLERRRRERLEPGFARVGRVAAGPEDEVACLGRTHDVLDRLDRHPQVQRHVDQAGAHRPEVGRGELRHRWRPGQDPVARLQAQRAQPPGGDPTPPLELAERPRARGPVVGPQAQGRLVAIARDGVVEQLEKGGGHRHRISAGAWHPVTMAGWIRSGLEAYRALRIRQALAAGGSGRQGGRRRSAVSLIERGQIDRLRVRELQRLADSARGRTRCPTSLAAARGWTAAGPGARGLVDAGRRPPPARRLGRRGRGVVLEVR